MMNKFFWVAVLVTVSASSAYAEVDWTPKLTLLQDSCATSFHIMEDLPKKYQNSIMKKSVMKKKHEYGGNNITTTYQLKDASAFRLPITKIQELENDENFSFKSFSIFFKDSSFLKLRSGFYYSAQGSGWQPYRLTADMLGQGVYENADDNIMIDYENTATGYSVSDESGDGMSCGTTLEFNKKDNSLTCSVICG